MARSHIFFGSPVAAAGDQTVTINALTTHAAIFAPTIQQQVTPTFITHAAIFAPTINQSVSLAFLTHAAIFAPTVVRDGRVEPSFLTHNAIFAPQVHQQVQATFITHAAQFNPTINQQVTPAFLTHRVQFAPTIIADQFVNPAFLTHAAIFAPTVNVTVAVGFITHAAIFAPQINLSVSPGFINQAGQTFSPVVQWTYYNTLEGGTDGVTVTTGNSGGASGIAFNAVTIGAGGTLTFDNDHVLGSLAMKAVNGTSQAAFASYQGGDVPVTYGRVAFYIEDTPAGNPNVFQVRNGGAVCASIRLTSGGFLAIANASGTSVDTSATTISPDQWWRIDFEIVHGVGSGTCSVDLFDDPSDVSPVETLTGSSADFGASGDEWCYGISNFPATAHTLWVDVINANDFAKPGPDTSDQTVLPAFLTHRVIHAPAIQQAQTVSVGFISHAVQFSPLIHQQVQPGFITHAVQHNPTILSGLTVAPSFIQHMVVFAPTIAFTGANVEGEVVATIRQLDEVISTVVVEPAHAATMTLARDDLVSATLGALAEVRSLDIALYAVKGSDVRAPV